jgi:hypothetical protein
MFALSTRAFGHTRPWQRHISIFRFLVEVVLHAAEDKLVNLFFRPGQIIDLGEGWNAILPACYFCSANLHLTSANTEPRHIHRTWILINSVLWERAGVRFCLLVTFVL